MSIALTRVQPAVSEAEIDRRMAFADAALGAAGHAVTDPQITAVRRRAIQGELTIEEAIAQTLAIIRAQ